MCASYIPSRNASDNAADIIEALGGDPRTGMCRCPCHDDRTPSLSVSDGDDDKVLFHCFGGCSQDAVLGALKALGLWRSAPSIKPAARSPHEKRNTTPLAMEILDAARHSAEWPQYYLRRRSINIDPMAVGLRQICASTAATIGLPRLPHVVAPIIDERGTPIGVQVTILTRDGSAKAESVKGARRTYGRLKGGYVLLGKPRSKHPLAIGEGVETVLSAMQLADLPCGIACLGDWNMTAVDPPASPAGYRIYADHDKSGVGERAARSLGCRLVRQGHRVWLAIPPKPGTDWNDVLMESEEW